MQDVAVDEAVWRAIPGGEEVLAIFEGAPSFGDAEILNLDLEPGQVTLRIHEKRKKLIVVFLLTDVINLKLEDFCSQNVVGRLAIARIQPCLQDFNLQWLDIGPKAKPFYQLRWTAIVGLEGSIEARHVSASVKPFDR